MNVPRTVIEPCIYCGVGVEREVWFDNGYPVDADYQWCKDCEHIHEENNPSLVTK